MSYEYGPLLDPVTHQRGDDGGGGPARLVAQSVPPAPPPPLPRLPLVHVLLRADRVTLRRVLGWKTLKR